MATKCRISRRVTKSARVNENRTKQSAKETHGETFFFFHVAAGQVETTRIAHFAEFASRLTGCGASIKSWPRARRKRRQCFRARSFRRGIPRRRASRDLEPARRALAATAGRTARRRARERINASVKRGLMMKQTCAIAPPPLFHRGGVGIAIGSSLRRSAHQSARRAATRPHTTPRDPVFCFSFPFDVRVLFFDSFTAFQLITEFQSGACSCSFIDREKIKKF